MKLATLATAYGTTTIRIESFDPSRGVGTATDLEYEDLGALLLHPSWEEAASMSGELIEFQATDLAPVVPNPGKIICVGVNYAKHAREMGRQLPQQPTLFVKFPDALTGPYDTIHLPPYAQAQPDYEGELAVIIGQRAHQVTEEEALDYVAGYAIINDYTLRDLQRATTQFHAGKSFYQTAGFGPWMTTSDEWQPGNHARIITTLDEQVRQDDDTDDLIFSVAHLISFCSSLYPLNPGDVIATGTPEGVGFARTPQGFIGHGQTVRISIDGLGQIANTTIFDPTYLPLAPEVNLLGSSSADSCGSDCHCHH